MRIGAITESTSGYGDNVIIQAIDLFDDGQGRISAPLADRS